MLYLLKRLLHQFDNQKPERMAQFNWSLTSNTGKQYVVGLFHGPDTGHVVVHCNSKVILIDFNVWQTKTYSFYVDSDLYKVEINGTPNNFSYDLQLDTHADTPGNRRRKLEQLEMQRYGWIALGSLLLIVGLVFVLRWYAA